MKILRLFIIPFLVCALVTSAMAENPDSSEDTSALRAQVEPLLRGFEKVPSAEDWKRLGPPEKVSAVLMEIADDKASRTILKLRAVSSLAHFPIDPVKTYLAGLVKQNDNVRLKSKAILAIAVAFKGAIIPEIQPQLSDENPLIRETVIKAMDEIGGPQAIKVVEAHLEIEKVTWVRATGTRVLKRLRATPPKK